MNDQSNLFIEEYQFVTSIFTFLLFLCSIDLRKKFMKKINKYLLFHEIVDQFLLNIKHNIKILKKLIQDLSITYFNISIFYRVSDSHNSLVYFSMNIS